MSYTESLDYFNEIDKITTKNVLQLAANDILEKFRHLTGTKRQNIIQFILYGRNSLKIKVREKTRIETYIFTYYDPTNWRIQTEDYKDA